MKMRNTFCELTDRVFWDRLDQVTLNGLIEQHFGIRLECEKNKEWVAVDDKALRGSIKQGDKQCV
jgi:acyl carrier protein